MSLSLRSSTPRRAALVALSLIALLGVPLVAAQAKGEPQTFPETGKTIQGRFAIYWETHGGADTLGYPITDEMQERSDADGLMYTVQYFQRAVLVLHPENPAWSDVVPLDPGTMRYDAKYAPAQPSNSRGGGAGGSGGGR